ncbi:MAG: chemotaxis protein CheX [bacterium]|nr:chemotaxis protein CheX [bacterium]
MPTNDATHSVLISATRDTLSTMAMIELESIEHTESENPAAELLDITSLLTLKGEPTHERTLLITVARELACEIVGAMLGDEPDKLDEAELLDGIGEVANMVAGIAKSALADAPQAFTLALPFAFSGPAPDSPATLAEAEHAYFAWGEAGGQRVGVGLLVRATPGD